MVKGLGIGVRNNELVVKGLGALGAFRGLENNELVAKGLGIRGLGVRGFRRSYGLTL